MWIPRTMVCAQRDVERESPAHATTRRAISYALVLLLAACAVALIPAARIGQFSHADERHYTDGALWMLETGDYWTPRYPDGSPRLRKPPGVYWAIAGSFKLFGISPASAHWASLAAGMLTLFVTFRMAREATGKSEVGLLAAAILLTHPHVFQYSNIVNPDIYQTLGITIGFAGLTRAIRHDWADGWARFYLLLGAGLAILTKGLLGIVFLVYGGTLIARIQCESLGRCARLLLLLVGISAGVASIVFLPFVLHHGRAFAADFLRDQIVGQLLATPPLSKLFHAIGYSIYLPLSLHLWLIPLFSAFRKSTAPPVKIELLRAYAGWGVLLILIFSLSSNVKPRYIMSAAPLLAVVAASWIHAVEPPASRFPVRIAAILLAALFGSFLIVGTWEKELVVPPLASLALLGIIAFLLARLRSIRWRSGLAAAVLAISWAPLSVIYSQNLWTHRAANTLAGVFQQTRGWIGETDVVLVDYSARDIALARLQLGKTFRTVLLSDYLWEKREDPVPARIRPSGNLLTAGGPPDEFEIAAMFDLPDTRLKRKGDTWTDAVRKGVNALRNGYPSQTYVLEIRRGLKPGGSDGSGPE